MCVFNEEREVMQIWQKVNNQPSLKEYVSSLYCFHYRLQFSILNIFHIIFTAKFRNPFLSLEDFFPLMDSVHFLCVDERDSRPLTRAAPHGESSLWRMSAWDFKPELTRKHHSVRKDYVTTLGLTYKEMAIYYHIELPKR